MRDTSGRTPVAAMVAAALRIAAEQVEDGRGGEQLTAIAERIDNELGGETCPLCQRMECEYMCPLTQARREAEKRHP